MNDTEVLLLEVTRLLNSQRLAVLATQNAGQPYTSLVSFAASPDLRHLLFATTRSTRKYANLLSNPCAAVLVDNRSNQEADIHSATAVTATGPVEEISNGARVDALACYLLKHPYLTDFVHSPTCALLSLAVRTYYLVRRFQDVVEIHMGPCTSSCP